MSQDWQNIAEAISGQVVTHEGIRMRIFVPLSTVNPGFFGAVVEGHPMPGKRGIGSEAYQAERRRLGDDWISSWEGELPESVCEQLKF